MWVEFISPNKHLVDGELLKIKRTLFGSKYLIKYECRYYDERGFSGTCTKCAWIKEKNIIAVYTDK